MWGKIVKLLFIVIFLPYYLIFRTIKSKKKLLLKIPLVGSEIIILIPIWFVLIVVIYFQVFGGLFATSPFEVVGRSMLPTLKDGELIFAKPYPGGLLSREEIKRGDIVTVHDSNKILVKRVIALPGDTFQIQEGFVYINGKLLDEPYTSSVRSTYGGAKINDCQTIKVPDEKILVLGDNRKLSSDSREKGLISYSSIIARIPLSDQNNLKKRWRDPSKDKGLQDTYVFDPTKYITFLNQKRKEKNIDPLRLDEKLSKSADLRAKAMLKSGDTSWEANKSGYPMWKSMSDAGYSNTTYGEYRLFGFYSPDDLIDFDREHPEVLNFFMKKEYDDIGIATEIGDFNGCRMGILVQQVAGYIPPNYKQSDIDSWKPNLAKLREILPSWEKIRDFSLTYNNNKKDADRLVEIINYRIGMIQTIITKMENRQWLNSAENNYIHNEDLQLFNEQEGIAKRLNSLKWQH